jgi:hypothetical protein
LAGNQFLWWEAYDHNEETFVPAREVFKCLWYTFFVGN